MRHFLLGTTLALGLAFACSPASAKTAKECKAEYAANKAAIKATQKKADFIAACRAGTEVVPGAAAAPATAPVPAQTAAPAPAAPTSTGFFGRKKAVPTPSAPAPSTAAVGASQFTSDAQAKARCPSDTVVWVNTRSHVYHFAGTHNYGHTKSGAFMCEADANAAGNRAPKNEKHP